LVRWYVSLRTVLLNMKISIRNHLTSHTSSSWSLGIYNALNKVWYCQWSMTPLRFFDDWGCSSWDR
jgi:hypothetical protein